jgi:hypothetical protein
MKRLLSPYSRKEVSKKSTASFAMSFALTPSRRLSAKSNDLAVRFFFCLALAYLIIDLDMLAFIHFRNGKIVKASMQRHECGAELVIFVPEDLNDRRAIVIPQPHPHSHPSFSDEKHTLTAKHALDEAISQVGIPGLTVSSLKKGNFDHNDFSLHNLHDLSSIWISGNRGITIG